MDCPECGEELCLECDGDGYVDDPDDGGTMPCPSCGGEHVCGENE